MSMTLEEAIGHYEESEKINKELAVICVSPMSRNHNLENAEKCRQMIEWLRELQERRRQPEIIYCKDCKHWRRQTNYQGSPLPFGFCESDDMWLSLSGETYEVENIDTDDDFYCGYAERREDETD